jgi:hypothetical protein
MQFNLLLDVDIDFLKQRARTEAKLINENPNSAKGRSFQEIYATCMYGQAAEVYMMSIGFKDDTKPYRDVIDPDGTPTEVKVTDRPSYVKYVLKRCNAAASDSTRQYAKRLYIWIGDKKTYTYTLHSIYNWNGKEFIVQ